MASLATSPDDWEISEEDAANVIEYKSPIYATLKTYEQNANMQDQTGHTIDKDGNPPLCCVTEIGKDANVTNLSTAPELKMDSEIESCENTPHIGAPPMYLAMKGDEVVNVQDLTLDNTDMNGSTPLQHVAEVSRDVLVAMPLTAPQVRMDSEIESCETTFHVDATPIHLLVKRGEEDANMQDQKVAVIDKDGNSDLHRAARDGQDDVIAELLTGPQMKLDGEVEHCELLLPMDAIQDGCISPAGESIILEYIRCAAQKKALKSVYEPAQAGLDVNAKNKFGDTPLHLAASKGHESVIKQLLKVQHIRSAVENHAGKTPLECAFDSGKEDVEKVLCEDSIVKDYIGNLYRDRQVHVDAANAILIGAALIASVTFASWMQPPMGYTTYYGELHADPIPAAPVSYLQYASFEHHEILMQAFWVCNSLSFFFSIAAVISGARSILPSHQIFNKQEVANLRRNLL